MYCPKCGTELPDGTNQCSACGQTLGQAETRMNAYAIVSLVLGIVSVGLSFVAPVGLVFGIVALVQINRSEGRQGGKGLAIAGIIVSSIMTLFSLLALALFIPLIQTIQQLAGPDG